MVSERERKKEGNKAVWDNGKVRGCNGKVERQRGVREREGERGRERDREREKERES